MFKKKVFIAGLKSGSWFCDTTIFAFLAGIFYGFEIYVDRIKLQVEQQSRQAEWRARAEASQYKPTGTPK